jgi:hypothetical protein
MSLNISTGIDPETGQVMKRISDNEVELTQAEQLFSELFNIQLDQGHSCPEAIARLAGGRVNPGLRSPTPTLDAILTADFVVWLCGGEQEDPFSGRRY